MDKCCENCRYCERIGYRYYCYGDRFTPRVEPDFCCSAWKPKLELNIDSIRKMSAEDLAEYLCQVQDMGPALTKSDWVNWLMTPTENELSKMKGDKSNV